jgi:hypothetical protein
MESWSLLICSIALKFQDMEKAYGIFGAAAEHEALKLVIDM